MNNKTNIKVNAVKIGDDEFRLMTYSSGNDELGEWDLKNLSNEVKWVAYAYNTQPYEGQGYALIAFADGFDLVDLGHCSCYGPLEDYQATERYSREELDKRIGKDFNGKEIVSTDWHFAEMQEFWETVRYALSQESN